MPGGRSTNLPFLNLTLGLENENQWWKLEDEIFFLGQTAYFQGRTVSFREYWMSGCPRRLWGSLTPFQPTTSWLDQAKSIIDQGWISVKEEGEIASIYATIVKIKNTLTFV